MDSLPVPSSCSRAFNIASVSSFRLAISPSSSVDECFLLLPCRECCLDAPFVVDGRLVWLPSKDSLDGTLFRECVRLD